MRVVTILGTRPEIIRLSLIIPLLDSCVEHTLVHTGQNFDDRLSELFFRELGIRAPDVSLQVEATGFGEQVGQMLARIEPVLFERRPDRILILGDTNSGLTAIVARRLGIPVFHMEAGNRCFDERVPEEINRRLIDHISSILLPYTLRSRENLLLEGIPPERVFVTGNPIKQVMDHFNDRIRASTALNDHRVQAEQYFLVTMHRSETVDQAEKLGDLVSALCLVAERYQMPVICSLHPRTRARAERFGIELRGDSVYFVPPLGLFDFLALENNAFCILTDSGTVQEEACILGVPTVTMREVTERPETVECGSNFVAGTTPEAILTAVDFVTGYRGKWVPPEEYLAPRVAETVCSLLLSHRI